MTGKTHAAVGLGTVLAVTQPSTVSGLVLAAGTGMLGALISDIDVGTSKSHKDANRITLIAVLLVAAEIALNYFYDFSIWEKIRNNQSMAPVAMQVVGVGFIVGVIQDSCETALNSSTDVLYTACACRIRKNK